MAAAAAAAALSLFLFCLFPTPSESLGSDSPPSVFDILPRFGLPSGLLPHSVSNYTLSSDGSFVVQLDHPCYLHFDYLVYYHPLISGTLKMGSITHLQGIQVQSFFLWFDVDQIKVHLPSSHSIYFQVGLVNKQLDVAQFTTIHSCRDAHSVQCGHPWMDIFKLPPPVDNEIPMLLTE